MTLARILAPALVVYCATSVLAQNALKDVLVTKIKKATVFIQASEGEDSATGSGFFVAKFSKSGIVATNHHVVFNGKKMAGRIEVVLNSGTSSERVLRAEVVASDAKADLALLKVEDSELPMPVELKGPTKVNETQRVFISGFPFGKMLSRDGKRPAVTISSCAVSSIRHSKDEDTTLIQLDGEIHPGNSGGPVIDSNGRLVGVATLKLSTQTSALPCQKCTSIKSWMGAYSALNLKERRRTAIRLCFL